MLKLPLIISDKNLRRCSSSRRRLSACASVTTHYPTGRLVPDVGQCTKWRARCSGKVPTSTLKIKICMLVDKISLMVSLFSFERSLKLPSVRIFADKCWNFLTRWRVESALCTSTVLSNPTLSNIAFMSGPGEDEWLSGILLSGGEQLRSSQHHYCPHCRGQSVILMITDKPWKFPILELHFHYFTNSHYFRVQ